MFGLGNIIFIAIKFLIYLSGLCNNIFLYIHMHMWDHTHTWFILSYTLESELLFCHFYKAFSAAQHTYVGPHKCVVLVTLYLLQANLYLSLWIMQQYF